MFSGLLLDICWIVSVALVRCDCLCSMRSECECLMWRLLVPEVVAQAGLREQGSPREIATTATCARATQNHQNHAQFALKKSQTPLELSKNPLDCILGISG